MKTKLIEDFEAICKTTEELLQLKDNYIKFLSEVVSKHSANNFARNGVSASAEEIQKGCDLRKEIEDKEKEIADLDVEFKSENKIQLNLKDLVGKYYEKGDSLIHVLHVTDDVANPIITFYCYSWTHKHVSLDCLSFFQFLECGFELNKDPYCFMENIYYENGRIKIKE